MRSEEELEMAINEQEEIFRGVHKKLADLRQERKDDVEIPRRQAMVGKFFRYHDRYGHEDEEGWDVYVRVVGVRSGCFNLKTVSFQKDSHGEIKIEVEDLCSVESLDKADEITEAEFLGAWDVIRAEMILAVEGRC